MIADECKSCKRSELDTELNHYKGFLLCTRCRNRSDQIDNATLTPYAEQGFAAFEYYQMTGQIPSWFPRSRVAQIKTKSGLYIGNGVVF